MTSADNDIYEQIALACVLVVFIGFLCYCALTFYQLGFNEGLAHAAEKRPFTIYNFEKHRRIDKQWQETETSGSDSRKLCEASETQAQEPA